jgi:hypothetical protein
MWTKSSDHLLALNDSIKNDGRHNSEDTQGMPFVTPSRYPGIGLFAFQFACLKKKKKKKKGDLLLEVDVERYRIVEFQRKQITQKIERLSSKE